MGGWPDRDQVGWLGYGAGEQLIVSLPTAVDAFRERNHPVDRLLLYADLDLDGLECARQADERGRKAGLPVLLPASVSSGHCLTRDARSVPAAPPPRLREAESWLPPDMASEVFDLLA